MMNSPVTSRIVVAVGLMVVFGIGLFSIFAVQPTPSHVAQNGPAAAMSNNQALTTTPPPTPAAPAAPAAPDQTAAGASASATDPATAPPASPPTASHTDANEGNASSTTTNVANTRKGGGSGAQAATSRHERTPAKSLGEDSSMRAAAAAPSNTTQPEPNADAGSVHEQSAEADASGADMNGAIAAQVRSSIASLAPGSNIDVKAMDGIVALAGSVPNETVAEDARQAAQQIAGVKQVDTSALTVTNP